MLLLGVAVLPSVVLAGCSAKTEAPSQAARPIAAPQSPEQRQQNQARVLQTIRTMTPEQRAAYFKEHPEDAVALTR